MVRTGDGEGYDRPNALRRPAAVVDFDYANACSAILSAASIPRTVTGRGWRCHAFAGTQKSLLSVAEFLLNVSYGVKRK
jgi:hypothetical protein